MAKKQISKAKRPPTAKPKKKKTTGKQDATPKHTRTKERQVPKPESIEQTKRRSVGETAQPTRVPRTNPVDSPKKLSTVRKADPSSKHPRAVKEDFGLDREQEKLGGQVANVLLRTTDTDAGTIHEQARRQKIRQTDQTFPTETVKVEGEKVQVGARPEKLDPEHMPAHKRDTKIKDDLRETPSAEDTRKADAPVTTPTGGDWRTLTPRYEAEEEKVTS